MRALKLLALYTLFTTSNAFALFGEVSLSLSQSPPLNFDQSTNTGTFTSYSSVLTLGELKVSPALMFSQALQVSRIDKYQYGFLTQAQTDLYAKNTYAYEYNANSQLNYQRGNYAASLALLYPISNNFVEQYGVDTSHSINFYNKSTILGFSYKYLRELRPESYFLDFDFTVKHRPARVNAHELSLFYEQILTERLKFRWRPFLINKPEERPDALGAELLFAYAPFLGHVAKVKGLYAKEMKTQSLKNERGYFSLVSLNFAWDYELTYSTLLGLAYNYQREDEQNPRNLTTRTLGLDSIAAFVEKKFSASTLKLSGDYSRSNLKSNFWGITLSLRREI